MKTNKTISNTSDNIKQFSKVTRIAGVLVIGLGAIMQPANAENSQVNPAKKSPDGKGNLPTFAQADVNGDHVVTKSELQNFPYLLQTFDKVDAGNDGQLEQHEFQNLKMETKREGEVK